MLGNSNSSIPLFSNFVATGFPSTAESYIENTIDLNKQLIRNHTTFILQADNDAMMGDGIFTRDKVIVDKAVRAYSGKLIIAELEGELLLRRLYRRHNTYFLLASNENYPAMRLQGHQLKIWGVVTYIIKEA